MATISSSQILHHISSFISEILLQFDLRHRLISTLRCEISVADEIALNRLNIAADTLENAISNPNRTLKSSSIRLSEQILLSFPQNVFSSFLLSLVYSLTHRPIDAASSLLRVLNLKPSLARSEIAQVLFEDLFSVHFIPVFQWFDEERSRILASKSPDSDSEINDTSFCDQSVVIPCTKLLSRMSEDQTFKLKELEKDYEDVLDENCTAFAQFFIEVLQNKNGNGSNRQPLLTLKNRKRCESLKNGEEEKVLTHEEFEWKNGRYNNVMCCIFLFIFSSIFKYSALIKRGKLGDKLGLCQADKNNSLVCFVSIEH